jgi:hypothetical protein
MNAVFGLLLSYPPLAILALLSGGLVVFVLWHGLRETRLQRRQRRQRERVRRAFWGYD